MQEQERIANEEAEKRLKAALTAKREPGATASRVASPAMGAGNPATPESTDPKPSSVDEVEPSMDIDSAAMPPPPQKDEVRCLNCLF